MTLATQCPFCSTTFRITEQQLAQHEGMVRCGVCSQVFNGNDFLQAAPLQEAAAEENNTSDSSITNNTPAANIADETVAEAPDEPVIDFTESTITSQEAHSHTTDTDTETAFASETDTLVLEDPVPTTDTQEADQSWNMQQEPVIEETASDDAIEMHAKEEVTLSEDAGVSDMTETTSPTIMEDDNQEPTLEESAIIAPTSGPDFLTLSKRRAKRQRITKIVLSVVAAILLIGVVIQSLYYWRHQIITTIPSSKPLYVAVCDKLHCSVGLPTQIDTLSLEANDLQAIPDVPNTYQLTILIRNNSHLAQTWPQLELSLNSQISTTLVRRVFAPKDYLMPAKVSDHGILPQTEQPVVIQFQLPEGTPISGYQVYLFYP